MKQPCFTRNKDETLYPMKRFIKNTLIFIVLLHMFFYSSAQTNNPDGFLNNGGTLKNSNAAFISSIGEPVVGLVNEGSLHFLQGFVYKTIPIDFNTASHDIKLESSKVLIYPNPASDHLFVSLSQAWDEPCHFLISTAEGVRMKNGIIADMTTDINITHLAPATYILLLYDQKNKKVLYRTLFVKFKTN